MNEELKIKLLNSLKTLKKNVFHSLLFILGSMIICLIYGFFLHGRLTLLYVFPGTFLVGSIIVFIGVIVALMPIRAKTKDKNKDLIDHTTYFSLTMERREKKRETAFTFLQLGMCIIMITAILQWVLAIIIR